MPTISCTMPPKRPAPTDNVASPPSHRTASINEHHHSPIAGQHPDMPDDAAVAIASPQTKRNKENENPAALDQISQNSILNDVAGVLPIDLLTQQPEPAIAVEPAVLPSASVPAAAGGARSAYLAAQQQRTVTCNLSLIPPSKHASWPQSQP
jgi:hypothetical protein